MKKYRPVFILILFCIVFSYNFMNRFDLPMHDEALYASGNTEIEGWSSLYPFIYKILNFFTNDPVTSFYVMLFSICFILTPLIIYLFTRRLGFSSIQSVIFSTIGLLSPWNFPSEPKIQLVNFLTLLLAFILRNQKRVYLFYVVVTLSLFFRTDNIIIILFFFIFDFYQSLKKHELKHFLKSLIWPMFLYLGLSLLWQTPFSSKRNYYAFQDHFSWKQEEFVSNNFHEDVKSRYEQVYDFFGGKPSIVNAIKTRPRESGQHFLANLKILLPALNSGYNLLTIIPSTIMFLIFFVIFLFNKENTDRVKDKEVARSFYLFTFCIIIKCFITSILLQPWLKYHFEFTFLLLVLVAFLMLQKISFFSFQRFKTWPLIIPILFCFDIYTKVFSIEVDLSKALSTIKKLDEENPFRAGIGNTGISQWYNKKIILNPAVNRDYDDQIRGSMKTFLDGNKIDLIVLEPDFRRLNAQNQIDAVWTQFEENFNSYGFCILRGEPLVNLSMYVRRHDCSSLQVTN